MICPNCGTQINDGERFCTECGTPVNPSASQTPPAMQNDNPGGYGGYAEPAAPVPPKPKASFKKTLGIIGICAAAVIVLVLLVGAIFTGGAKNQLGLAIKQSSRDLSSIASKSLKGTELTAGIDFAKLLDEDDLDLTADISVFVSDKTAAAKFSIEDEDNTLDLSLIATEKAITAASSLLDGKAYGISVKDLAKNLQGSIFDPDSETPVSMDEETFEALIETLSKDNSKTAKELEKEFNKAATSFYNALWKSLKKNASIKTGKEKLDFVDEEKVKCITIEIDQDGIAALTEDMINWAQSSKELEAFIDKCISVIDEDTFSSLVGMMDFPKALSDISELKENFYDGLDNIADEIDDLKDEIEDADIEIGLKFFINGSKQIVGIMCEYDIEGSSGELEFVVGPKYEDLQCIRVFAKSGKTAILNAEYTVSQNDSKAYKGKLSVKMYKNEIASAKVDYSKKAGDFKLSGTYYGDDFSFECSAPKKGSVYTISGIKIEYGYIDKKIKGLSLTLDTGAKAPSQPKYTEVLSLDMDDISEISDEAVEKLQEYSDGDIGKLLDLADRYF